MHVELWQSPYKNLTILVHASYNIGILTNTHISISNLLSQPSIPNVYIIVGFKDGKPSFTEMSYRAVC